MQLQKCIGSAVYAMGIERFLSLVPISLDEHSYTYSNIWLVPILKRYVNGASLAYYMEHIMPLAKSFKKASRKGVFNVICFEAVFFLPFYSFLLRWRKLELFSSVYSLSVIATCIALSMVPIPLFLYLFGLEMDGACLIFYYFHSIEASQNNGV